MKELGQVHGGGGGSANDSTYSAHTPSGADPGFDRGGPDRDRPKTAILGPQFCRILVLGPYFWWSRGGGGRAPGSAPAPYSKHMQLQLLVFCKCLISNHVNSALRKRVELVKYIRVTMRK